MTTYAAADVLEGKGIPVRVHSLHSILVVRQPLLSPLSERARGCPLVRILHLFHFEAKQVSNCMHDYVSRHAS